jgi:predicted aldo/keto reductase-like oxidoreductase
MPDQADWVLSDEEDGLMAAALEWKKQGKIKHIGFSTHGSADVIMRLIKSNKFDYVNLHYHFFGSYHAEGTPDTNGGHGNLACVKKALELDMGVFNISPVDKGGHLYQPSSTVARLIGTKMSPISFASLRSWETAQMHTVSVGFARPEDLDEILEAAELFTRKKEMKALLEGAENRLIKHAEETIGKEWVEKSLINLPSFFEESTKGVGMGHILWCYNMLNAYGMYDTARARYTKLETSNKWNHKKSFEENLKTM